MWVGGIGSSGYLSTLLCSLAPSLPPRRLCAEVPEQWADEASPEGVLLDLVRKLSAFCLEHSAESEACDMLMEIERIDMLLELVSEDVHERVCLYLIRLVM